MNPSKAKSKSKSNSLWSSSVTRLLHKCKLGPWTSICKWMAIYGQGTRQNGPSSSRRNSRLLLTPCNQNLHFPSILLSLWPPSKIWNLATLSTIWVQFASQYALPLSLSFQYPAQQRAKKKCPRPFYVSLPIKKREQERKAVVIDEDIVCCADGNGARRGQ